PEAALDLLERSVLLAHLAQVGQAPAEEEEGRLLLVDGQDLNLQRRRHRHLPQPPDSLRAPALPPDRLELVEEVDLLVVLGVLRNAARLEPREARQLPRRRLLLDRHLSLLSRPPRMRYVNRRETRLGVAGERAADGRARSRDRRRL